VVHDDGGDPAWSQRYKTNKAKLQSGDLTLVAETIRELAERDADRGLAHKQDAHICKFEWRDRTW
jgi:RNA polymerase-interacting CarD/CdnL/TRCF family regulator